MKRTAIILITILVLALGAWFLIAAKRSPTQTPMVRLTSPLTNSIITSPLTVTGEARGNWYFEASFPVKVLDGNGKVLGQVPAQAQGDWMTTEFVPFSATVPFTTPTTATGYLVLEKDNPSGLPENAAELSVPIRFASEELSQP